jgi:glycosyltransferase involved in cell wall biosynthesis
MKNVLFSIILPTYNSEKTLSRCLNSIINQKFVSFEIVIVDGYSDDSTLEIINQYRFKFPNIIVQSEKDLGIYDAMNKGIHLSTGMYLYFIGSDDCFYNSKILEHVANYTENYTYDVIYGDVYNTSLNKIIGGVITEEKLMKHQVCHQAIFYKRDLFYSFGNYDIKMEVNADMYFNHIVFRNNKIRQKYIDLVICKYDGSGFSSYTYDEEYWSKARVFFFSYYKKKVSKRVIYQNLLPIVKNKFAFSGLILSLEALCVSGNFSLLFNWLNHPYQYLKLFVRKKIFGN